MSARGKTTFGLMVLLTLSGLVAVQKFCPSAPTPVSAPPKTRAQTPVNPAHLAVLENLLREVETDWLPNATTSPAAARAAAAGPSSPTQTTQEKKK